MADDDVLSPAQGATPPKGATAPEPATAPEAATAAIVVRGRATPEELAALVAVLAAAGGGEDPASGDATSTWAAHAAAMRRPVGHGPGAWRTALRP